MSAVKVNSEMFERAETLVAWFEIKPLQWSTVIAVRAALRVLPVDIGIDDAPQAFRAAAIARFSARYPNSAMDARYIDLSGRAAPFSGLGGTAPELCAARTAALVAGARLGKTEAREAHLAATEAIMAARALAIHAQSEAEFSKAMVDDFELLLDGVAFGEIVESGIWQHSQPPRIAGAWQFFSDLLRNQGNHWDVWVKWYDDLVVGRRSTELEEAAYTDIPDWLPWNKPLDLNTEIARRLASFHPDPAPVEGIPSPITINRLPDGRIGVEAGPFSLPTVPPPSTPEDHRRVLAACHSWSAQLTKIASSPQFQGRPEYAQFLRDYIEWLPNEHGAGNMLLADGEARALNKLFTAEESILPVAFAGKLSVLLEDHIGLRSFYPEIERHYHAVSTGRLIKPLSRDTVEIIQRIVRSQTPLVFDESVSPAIDEAAKPFPNIEPLPSGETPPADPNRPKPPRDPIVDADPRKSQDYTIASAYNRIWSILQKGRGTAEAIEGWQKTYALLKPHIGAIIEFLKNFWPMDGTGGPTLPPTISV